MRASGIRRWVRPQLRVSNTVLTSILDELKTLATEVQTLVQSKVAPTAFTSVYSKIRENVRGVQQERKIKRTLLAATNPEQAAKRKTKKNESKKESRKRKNAAFA